MKPTESLTLPERLSSKVATTAKPEVPDLMQARADFNRDPAYREIFDKAFLEDFDDEWLVSTLAAKLNEGWGGHSGGAAKEAAQYLVDEYRQLGEGVHLVSSETGQVVTTLTEEDIWQPPMVAREGSDALAQPLKAIRPELAAFITTWTFDRSHESKVVAALAKRGHQTALLAEEGDPRLLVASRKGRQHIVRSLGRSDPKDFLRACGGTSGAFLQRFELTSEPLENPDLEGTVSSQSIIGIHDQTTVNLHHNRPATMRGALTQGWVRAIAKRLVEGALRAGKASETRLTDLKALKSHSVDLWIAPPEAIARMKRAEIQVPVLPVAGIEAVLGIKGGAGTLFVPNDFEIGSREWFSRWETETELKFALKVNWDAFSAYEIEGLVYQSVVVR